MTEEIIINGVDVSGCEKQGETIAGITCGNGERIRLANEIITKHKLCKDNFNCYYKQLKRKERECQQAMDNYVQLDLQRVKEYNELVDLYKAKEQECEELKKERDTLSITRNKLLDDLWVVEENLKDYMEHFNKASDELDKLKVENEKMSKGYAELTEIVRPYIDDFTGHNEKLGGFDIVLCVKELLQQLDSLKAEVKSKTEYIQEQREIIDQYSKEIEMYKNVKETGQVREKKNSNKPLLR